MNKTEHTSNTEDYAIAKSLNDYVLNIFSFIRLYQLIGPAKEYDDKELNRAYVLLVNQLEIIYSRNPALMAIKPEPIWRKFELIKGRSHSIQKYLENNDSGHEHTDKVEKLCIISNNEIPVFSKEQRRIIDLTDNLKTKYNSLLEEAVSRLHANSTDYEEDPWPPRVWYIPEYTLTYKSDGTILVNDSLKLKKIHAGSTTEHLLEQAIKNPNRLFKPDLGRTSRNISTVLSSAGFTPVLRELFFPTVSDDKGVVFRPTIKREDAVSEMITLYDLDTQLYKSGAKTELLPREALIELGFSDDD